MSIIDKLRIQISFEIVICSKIKPNRRVLRVHVSCHYRNSLKMLDFKWISYIFQWCQLLKYIAGKRNKLN